jgi:Fur family ferric uptake transcriptional regulator
MEDQQRQLSTQAAIAEIIKSIPRGDHLTAPEVYEKAKEQGLRVSLSTIYRTLNRLKAEGDVSTVAGDRGLRYESREEGPAHDHLICLGCGLTIEFFDELIRGFGKTVAQRKGFAHTTSRFDILGYCEKCQDEKNEPQIGQIQEILELSKNKLTLAIKEIELCQANLTGGQLTGIPVRTAINLVNESLEELENLNQELETQEELI